MLHWEESTAVSGTRPLYKVNHPEREKVPIQLTEHYREVGGGGRARKGSTPPGGGGIRSI